IRMSDSKLTADESGYDDRRIAELEVRVRELETARARADKEKKELEKRWQRTLLSHRFYLGLFVALIGLGAWIFGILKGAYETQLVGTAALAVGSVLIASALVEGEQTLLSRTTPSQR